jgi:hypothetical protein
MKNKKPSAVGFRVVTRMVRATPPAKALCVDGTNGIIAYTLTTFSDGSHRILVYVSDVEDNDDGAGDND